MDPPGSALDRPGPVHPRGASTLEIRVLAVDDNRVNLTLIAGLLELRGVSASLAADGAEAVLLACDRRFDLILMDLQMPVLDGFAATAAIRRYEADHGLPPVPVIAYSSSVPGDCELALHGLSGSLLKPCAEQELESCLILWCPAYPPTHQGRACNGTGHTRAGRQVEPHRAARE